jgi:hypothetical protein
VNLDNADRGDAAINATEATRTSRRPPTILADTVNMQRPQTSLLAPFDSLEFLSQPSENMDSQASGLQTPLSDYTRTAEAMSQYLTWDAVEWWNLATHNDL